MTTYTATITHPSISRARVIGPFNSLLSAKLAATKEFGDEQVDYCLAVYAQDDGYPPFLAASRRVSASRWR